MRLNEAYLQLQELLEFCPVCGGDLETNPVDPSKRSCYQHGDFIVRWTGNGYLVEWKFLILKERVENRGTRRPREAQTEDSVLSSVRYVSEEDERNE